MRYEIARKLSEAFDNVDDGLTVEVTHTETGYVRVTARKIWYAVELVPMEKLASVTDETACDLLMQAASKAVETVINHK